MNGSAELLSGSTEFSSEVRYSCGEGYYLVGEADHVCEADGSWSGKEPRCEGMNIIIAL